MKMEKRWGLFIVKIIAITCLIFISCCYKKPDEKIFYTYIQSDPGRLDPFYSTDVISGRILAKMCNGLFKIDKDRKLRSDIVKEYRFDGKTLIAKLKDDVLFSNGEPLRAHDILFSFERIRNSRNPTSPRKWIFENIKDITTKNDHTIIIELKSYSSTFLYLLTMPNCYIISKNSYQREREIIGSGPFKLTEWKRDERIYLEKNSRYFNSRAKINGIVFKIIPEDLTARFEFLNETIDYFELPYLANINLKVKGEGIKLIKIPALSVHYIALNTRRYPFNNRSFRKALNMAIDRERILESLFKNRFKKATGPIPTKVGDYRATTRSIPYNPQKAREIIELLNLHNKTLILFIKSDHQVSLISQMLQYYLNEAGLSIKIREMEWSALKAATLNGNFDMAYFTWHADYPEAENFLFPLFFSKNIGAGGNRSFYTNRVVDRLLLEARRTINKHKRYNIYKKIEGIIIDDAPWIFLWYGDKRIALSNRLEQFIPYSIYNGMKGNEILFKTNTL